MTRPPRSELLKNTQAAQAHRGRVPFIEPLVLQDARGQWAWWTFAGLNANAPLAAALKEAGAPVGSADNYRIALDSAIPVSVIESLRGRPIEAFAAPVSEKAVEGLKFSECLLKWLAEKELAMRMTDAESASITSGRAVVSSSREV